ncbi:G-protein coupled receptor Mth2-like isoform 2-T2 [Cochliomyia hominivorax]
MLLLFVLFVNPILISSTLISELNKTTIQLCCQKWEYFDMNEYKCKQLPSDVSVEWNLRINYPNETEMNLNIFNNFIHNINLPCEKPEALYWRLNNSIDFDLVSDVEYCFTPFPLKNTKKYVLVQLNCRLELHLLLAFQHEIVYFFSGFLLIPTLIVYIILKPLNENLMGKCFICYLTTVLMANTFYLLIPQMLRINYHIPNLIYILIAYTHFYVNMSNVFWLNVLGFDAWRTFSDSNEDLDSQEKKKRFIFYSLYVWIISAVTTAPAVVRNFSNIYEYCNQCEQSESCVMIIINFLISCGVSWKIYRIKRKSAATVHNRQYLAESTTICLRLFVLMGPHWIIMYLLKDYEFIEILIFTMNYIESLLIFILFVLKKNILKLLFKKH